MWTYTNTSCLLATTIYVTLVTVTLCRVASQASSYNGNSGKIRHNAFASALTSNERGSGSTQGTVTGNMLQQVQDDILNNLGMSQPPNQSVNSDNIPEFARQLALQQAGVLDSQSEDDEKHFMAEISNLLLIAKKIHTAGFGETIQFMVNSADRSSKMSEIKLYYHINSANVTMHEDSTDTKMLLRLSLLTQDADGSISSQLIENIGIHKHLVGWHSQVISSSLIRYELMNRGSIADNITLNFHLSCLNCEYQVFPSVITKQNVPFLRMNGRRRQRRNGASQCNGRCCLQELIVDFEALGWNWVIHPPRYTANYCSGSCLSPSSSERKQMSSNSHILNAMLNNLRQGSTSSCCVSDTSYEDFKPIVYTDESGEVRSNRNTIRTINSCRCS